MAKIIGSLTSVDRERQVAALLRAEAAGHATDRRLTGVYRSVLELVRMIAHAVSTARVSYGDHYGKREEEPDSMGATGGPAILQVQILPNILPIPQM